MINVDNIFSHELIGLETKIVQSTNPEIIGLNGRIVNETKSMFTINTKKGAKTIAKNTNNWEFTVDGKSIEIEGTKIAKRPFDRIGGKT
ncbi:ribonuclease P protein subunit [Nitrosopumilus sp.]|uniref:ribonuclease P protein component 1 n=1 Tax=Nitrosopumilus sp. TaxID=2024843 RepID=UPI00247B9B34|nr:ribonuclease P protein subunit [Nitrosopumilus sp.]MCV0430015.1 ribonuclease P protein subunit [Nitrosopumilus sp.]